MKILFFICVTIQLVSFRFVVAQNENKVVKKSFADRDIEIVFRDKQQKVATVNTFDKLGNLLSEENYSNYKYEVRGGYSKAYYPTGETYWIADYRDGQLHGEFRVFYQNSLPKRREVYKRGIRFKKECFDIDGNEAPFYEFATQARFPDGSFALQGFIRSCFSSTKINLGNSISILTFIAKADSSMQLLMAAPTEYLLPINIEKMVKNMPRWIPATTDNQPYDSKVEIRLVFQHGTVYLMEIAPNFRELERRGVRDIIIPTEGPTIPTRTTRRF